MPKKRQGIVMVVSAPSGAGKTTLCRELLKRFPDLHFSISYTTRLPRPREKNGREYHFISPEEFAERERKGEFAETEELFGHRYGTSREDIDAVLEQGGDVLLDVDTKGAKTLKRVWNGAVFVFILPPSMDTLRLRLQQRGSEDDAAIARRLQRAVDEIKDTRWYDYIIYNDILEVSVFVLQSIYVAEQNRRERHMDKLAEFIRPQGGRNDDGTGYR